MFRILRRVRVAEDELIDSADADPDEGAADARPRQRDHVEEVHLVACHITRLMFEAATAMHTAVIDAWRSLRQLSKRHEASVWHLVTQIRCQQHIKDLQTVPERYRLSMAHWHALSEACGRAVGLISRKRAGASLTICCM